MGLAKLKAKAAFYTTYANELEKQNEEPFNNRNFINTTRDNDIIRDTNKNICEAFSRKECNAIKRAIILTAQNDNADPDLLDITNELRSESIKAKPLLSKIDCLSYDK